MRLVGPLVVFASALALVACNPPSPPKRPENAAKPTSKKPPAPAKPKKPKPSDPWLQGIVAKAEVKVKDKAGKVTTCVYDAKRKRHDCEGLPRWLHVQAKVQKVGGKEVYCVWNHPLKNGTVTTKLPGVAKQALEFRHGFIARAATRPDLAAVDAELRVDGKSVAKSRRDRKPGWATTTIAASKGAGDLEIVIKTKLDAAAHYCWQLKRASNGGATSATPPPAPVPTKAKLGKPAIKADAKPPAKTAKKKK